MQDFNNPAIVTIPTSTEHSSDLEQLLDEVTSQHPAASIGDDMFDLDKLLAESLSRKADELRIKAARKSLAAGVASAEEREALRALVSGWELKREWTPVFDTIMFDVQECTHCGSKHKHFVGIFQQQEHKTSKISRWVKAGAVCKLPRNVKENLQHVSVCCECAGMQGWEVVGAA